MWCGGRVSFCVYMEFDLRFVLLFLFSYLFHGLEVRLGVCALVRLKVFTVAILAQGTNRGDALCAALLSNQVGSILHDVTFSFSTCAHYVFTSCRPEFVFRYEYKLWQRDFPFLAARSPRFFFSLSPA